MTEGFRRQTRDAKSHGGAPFVLLLDFVVKPQHTITDGTPLSAFCDEPLLGMTAEQDSLLPVARRLALSMDGEDIGKQRKAGLDTPCTGT